MISFSVAYLLVLSAIIATGRFFRTGRKLRACYARKSADEARTGNLGFSCGGGKQSGNCTKNIVHCSGDCAGSRARDFAKVRSARSHSSSSVRYSERISSRRTFRQSILSLAVYKNCQTSLAKKYEFYELSNPIKKIT